MLTHNRQNSKLNLAVAFNPSLDCWPLDAASNLAAAHGFRVFVFAAPMLPTCTVTKYSPCLDVRIVRIKMLQ